MCTLPAPALAAHIDSSDLAAETIAHSQPVFADEQEQGEEEEEEVEEPNKKRHRMDHATLRALLTKVSESTGGKLLARQEEQIRELDGSLKGIEERLTGIDGTNAGMETKQTSMEDRLSALEKQRGTSSDGGSTTAGFSGG